MMKEIFTNYWNQLLMLIAIGGYFGKRFFDLASKKSEIKFNLYYQNKIDAIKVFFSSASKLNKAILDYINITISKEAKTNLNDALTSLYIHRNDLKFFLTTQEYERASALCKFYQNEISSILENAGKELIENIRSARFEAENDLRNLLRKDFH